MSLWLFVGINPILISHFVFLFVPLKCAFLYGFTFPLGPSLVFVPFLIKSIFYYYQTGRRNNGRVNVHKFWNMFLWWIRICFVSVVVGREKYRMRVGGYIKLVLKLTTCIFYFLTTCRLFLFSSFIYSLLMAF